jgi:hypothetical protein
MARRILSVAAVRRGGGCGSSNSAVGPDRELWEDAQSGLASAAGRAGLGARRR